MAFGVVVLHKLIIVLKKIADIKIKKDNGTGVAVPVNSVGDSRKRRACEERIRKPDVSVKKAALISKGSVAGKDNSP